MALAVTEGDIPIRICRNPLAVWSEVEPLLRKAIEKGGYTTDSVLTDIQIGECQLWLGDQCAVVTRILDKPLERTLWTEWLGGKNMGEWIGELDEVLGEFAKATGCTAVEFQGRPGWKKYEKAFEDYRAVATVYRKEYGQ